MPAIIRRMLESFRKNTGSLDRSHHSSWLTTMLPTTSNHQPPDEVVRAGKILQTHGFFLDRVISRCGHSGLVERYIFAQSRFSIVIDCGNQKYRIRFIAPPSGRMTFITNGGSWELAPSSPEDGIERLFPRSEKKSEFRWRLTTNSTIDLVRYVFIRERYSWRNYFRDGADNPWIIFNAID